VNRRAAQIGSLRHDRTVSGGGGDAYSCRIAHAGMAMGVAARWAGASLIDQACLGGNSPNIRGRPALCPLGLLDIGCVSARICYAVATAPPGYEYLPSPPPPPRCRRVRSG
jgi:hypothetical protein